MTVRIMLGAAVAAAAMTPALARHAPVHRAAPPQRTVQLISMLAGGPAAEPAGEPEEAAAQTPAAAAPPPPSFALHDLSRRWVEYQMQASLASAPAPAGLPSIRDDDPFAPQARAAAPAADDVPPPAIAIGVPGWMIGRGAANPAAVRFAPGCAAVPYRPSGFLGLGSEARRQAYYGMMSAIACQYGVPVGLFDAMIIRESRYDPAIVSPKNAFGLTQLMPATAAGLGVDRYDVEQNLRGGARFLRQQLDRFGQVHLALAAYNAGPGRVHGQVPAITETQGYVADILDKWARLSGLGVTAPRPTRAVVHAPATVRSPGATMMLF